MSQTISAQDVFRLIPHLSFNLQNYIKKASSILSLESRKNTVLLIDNQYILRTKKIKLHDFDDIGSCVNFKRAIDWIEKYKFVYHPQFIILEESVNSQGEKTEFLFYKKIQGTILKTIFPHLSKNDQISVAKQAAQVLYKLHQIPTPQIGFFYGQQFPAWFDFIRYWIDNQAKYITESEILTNKEINRIKQIFLIHKSLFSISRPFAVHLDFNSSNILINTKGEINCIIDWDNARGGDPILDLIYTTERAYNNRKYAEFTSSLLKEYLHISGIKNDQEFTLKYRLYSLFYAYKLLPVHVHHITDTHENVQELVKEVRQILKTF